MSEERASGGERGRWSSRRKMEVVLRALRGEDLDALRARRFLETAPQFRVMAPDAVGIEGEALAALGRMEEAEVALLRAGAEAVAMRAQPPRWRACLALGNLFERTGRVEQAADEYPEDLPLLEAMAGTLSDPDLRQSFVGSEPIERARAGA
jgi:hypothetical protein